MLRYSLLIVLTSVFPLLGSAQGPNESYVTRAKHDRDAAAKIIPTKNFEQFVPYWTAEGGWHTELQLRNNLSSSSLTVTPALRTPEGLETTLKPITLLPGEVQSLNLHDALAQVASSLAAQANAYGSAVLRYTSKSRQNLYASAMVHDTGHPIMYHLDGTYQSAGMVAGSREGIWWLPKKSVHDYLILVNQADHTIEGTLWLYDAAGKPWSEPLQLAPRQTVRLSVRQLIAQAGFFGQYGGMKVEMAKDAGSLDTVHILFDEVAGFAATMKMFDYSPKVKLAERDYAETGHWTTRAPMLALTHPDPVLAFPAATILRPMLFLRNTTGRQVQASLSFHWRDSSRDGHVTIPPVALAPFEVLRLNVKELQEKGTIPSDANWAQVSLTTDTAPDEVTAIAASYDSTLRYGSQTPFSDQLSAHLEGGQWQVDTTHNSLIAAGNGGNKPLHAALTILYDQGRKQYHMEQTIGADDQWWINMGQLIRSGKPDVSGSVLPQDLTSGAYQLRTISQTESGLLYEGKVITDKTFGHATYGCMVCCGYGGDVGLPFLMADPTQISMSETGYLDVYATNACTGNNDSVDSYFPSWGSSNTSIFTANSFSITGVGIGSAQVRANATRMPSGDGEETRSICPMTAMEADGTGNVLQLTCSSTVRGGNTTCVASGPSGTTFSDWSFTDGANIVNRSTSSATWSGVAVVSGNVSVRANLPDGGTSTLATPLTVSPRTGWAFSAHAATQVTPTTSCPGPQPSSTPTSGSYTGTACIAASASFSYATLGSGPNQGYGYITSDTDTGSFTYAISADIQNPASTFYQAQCGNYNSNTNPNGFISGATLNVDTVRHEAGPTPGPSHYSFYVGNVNVSSNNIGVQLESVIAAPGQSIQSLGNSATTTAANALINADMEPCGTHATNLNAACVLDGYVNVSPYASCN